ncbi:MAG: transketolase [Bacteroidales bacterium]|jgi:transketolase|nr:transketolase [Bacteroidales bacterium]MBQ1191027.1 transketolase [Bacteroidales bacterium]MBQ2303008.1 transketolase [Bacteroidales bacterium]MBQ2385738.1 transketolase [Bacteroidales bacterium]MEE1203805.1 transketolase [Bacteroidales bacterium]
MADLKQMQDIATQVRRDIIRMVHGCQSGHPGGSLGCADFMTALYFDVMELDVENFTRSGKGEDMFFLSNGHISPVWYSVLSRRGYFPVSELATFRRLGTRLQGHPSVHDNLPGVRQASGSLGQGLSVAVGAALAKKMDGDDKLVYVLHGDGELQEGQIWEAVMFAGAKGVDNLIATVDVNMLQIDGSTDQVCSLGDLRAKFEAFMWEVVEAEGNDMQAIVEGLKQAKAKTKQGKPVVILMRTQMGFGVDFMQNKNKWHGTPPNDEQAAQALAQLEETLGDY